VAIENITHVESEIRDANMAVETTDFTRSQILQSASTAMLAQANAMSQNTLQLLQSI
jgi:flagellin